MKRSLQVILFTGLIAILSIVYLTLRPAPEDGAVEVCEAYIQSMLRSPSTYQQISSNVVSSPMWENVQSAIIEYDADNAYGTPVRGTEICEFKLDDDGAIPPKYLLDGDRQIRESENSLREIQLLSGEEPSDIQENIMNCCISVDEKLNPSYSRA